MKFKSIIRLVKSADVPEVLEIYKPFITSSNITPEYEIPALHDFLVKIKSISNHYPFLVCEANNKIIGYTFANQFRLAQGHQWSAETSIYLSSAFYGKGVARYPSV